MRFGLVLVVLSLFALPATACSLMAVAGSAALLRPEAIDQQLFAAAILAEANQMRCRAGMSPVKPSAALVTVAARHSGWMAETETVSHDSGLPGISGLGDRLRTAGHAGHGGTENIGQVQRFLIDTYPHFKIISAAGCKFATDAGAPIAAHSYRSLAKYMVALWMHSPLHKANILNRKMKWMGAGIRFDPRSPFCGQFYVTQTFSG